MLNRKNKSEKPSAPTEEEFLKFVPKRADLPWSENSEGLVEIQTPKFQSNFGKSFVKALKKDECFTAKMDKIGSAVWKECDGAQSVEQILKNLKKKFPDIKEMDQKLFWYLQQLNSLKYIVLLVRTSGK